MWIPTVTGKGDKNRDPRCSPVMPNTWMKQRISVVWLHTMTLTCWQMIKTKDIYDVTGVCQTLVPVLSGRKQTIFLTVHHFRCHFESNMLQIHISPINVMLILVATLFFPEDKMFKVKWTHHVLSWTVKCAFNLCCSKQGHISQTPRIWSSKNIK